MYASSKNDSGIAIARRLTSILSKNTLRNSNAFQKVKKWISITPYRSSEKFFLLLFLDLQDQILSRHENFEKPIFLLKRNYGIVDISGSFGLLRNWINFSLSIELERMHSQLSMRLYCIISLAHFRI